MFEVACGVFSPLPFRGGSVRFQVKETIND